MTPQRCVALLRRPQSSDHRSPLLPRLRSTLPPPLPTNSPSPPEEVRDWVCARSKQRALAPSSLVLNRA